MSKEAFKSFKGQTKDLQRAGIAPETCVAREIAASIIARALDSRILPVTVPLTHQGQAGSAQRFMDGMISGRGNAGANGSHESSGASSTTTGQPRSRHPPPLLTPGGPSIPATAIPPASKSSSSGQQPSTIVNNGQPPSTSGSSPSRPATQQQRPERAVPRQAPAPEQAGSTVTRPEKWRRATPERTQPDAPWLDGFWPLPGGIPRP